MSPEVQQTLIGRVPDKVSRAFLPLNFSRHPVIGQVYPGVIRNDEIQPFSAKVTTSELEDKCVNGLILTDLDDDEMKIFDWFEDVEYERQIIPIYSIEGEDDAINIVDASVYIWVAGISQLELALSWDYEKFRSTQLDWYLQHTVIPCRQGIEKLGLDAL
jgi:hypothetical protein